MFSVLQCFNLSLTDALLDYVYENWKSVEAYYTTVHKDVTFTDQTLYGFLRNVVATAAMSSKIDNILPLAQEATTSRDTYYARIASFFVAGSVDVGYMSERIYDTHIPFAYYSAAKLGLFKLSEQASGY